jgi:hypothetical protein
VGIWLSYLEQLIFSSKERVLLLKAYMVKNKVPGLMPSCKYALTHTAKVGNVFYFICHECQELVRRKFCFSQFILVAMHVSGVLLCRHGAASTWQGFKLMKIATDTHEMPTNIHANELFLISMFSHDLKDSEKDIRMLKMIHGVAVKR